VVSKSEITLFFISSFASSETSFTTTYLTNDKILSISFVESWSNWWIPPEVEFLYHT
jgi:hypothetical protein